MYGIVIKYKKTLLALLASTVVTGIFIGIFAPGSYMPTTASILGTWTQYVQGGKMNFILGCLSLVVSFASAAIAAYMLKYDEEGSGVAK